MFVAIDTSGRKGALSIEENGKIIYSVDFNNFNSHSSFLTQIVNYALNSIKKELSDITAVGVVDGPGSFTGLRISFAYMQGLTFGNESIDRYKMSSIFNPVSFMLNNYKNSFDGFYNVIKIKSGFNVVAKFYFKSIEKPELFVYENDFNEENFDNFLYISNSDEVELNTTFVDYYNFGLNSASEFIKSLKTINLDKLTDSDLFSPNYFKKSEAEIAHVKKKKA